MKSGFFAGLALGAIIGAIILEASPEAKKWVQKGQDMIEEGMKKKK